MEIMYITDKHKCRNLGGNLLWAENIPVLARSFQKIDKVFYDKHLLVMHLG